MQAHVQKNGTCLLPANYRITSIVTAENSESTVWTVYFECDSWMTFHISTLVKINVYKVSA